MMAYGQYPSETTNDALGSFGAFVQSGWNELHTLPETDKHSLHHGVKMLKAYFKHYCADHLEVLVDSQGPLIERTASLQLYSDATVEIHWFGTIDVILKNKETGIIIVADHKTTAALGTEFYNRCRPNFQYSGYVMLAQKALGLDTNLFMINGLQTAKTKTEFARQITERTEEDFEELKDAACTQVFRWLAALEKGSFIQTTPSPCASYGGCQYRPLCEVPANMRENVIRSRYS